MGFFGKIDLLFFERLNSLAGRLEFLDAAIIFSATYVWYWVMAAVTFIAVLSFMPRFRQNLKRSAEFFIFTFVSAFTARFIFTEIIRLLYNRPRPFEIIEGSYQLINHAAGGSFPSGHAALSFAVAAAVAFYYPKTSIAFFIAAILIVAGRITAGVHFPSDILGGAIIGVGTAWLLWFASAKFRENLNGN